VIVEWSKPARRDLFAVSEYIAQDNPAAADHVVERIEQAVDRLARHPGLGRPGRVAGTRELIIATLPYVVPYRLRGDRVQILRVLHAARQWPETFAD
jgi:addiction module RelE/StbE family toxin